MHHNNVKSVYQIRKYVNNVDCFNVNINKCYTNLIIHIKDYNGNFIDTINSIEPIYCKHKLNHPHKGLYVIDNCGSYLNVQFKTTITSHIDIYLQ